MQVISDNTKYFSKGGAKKMSYSRTMNLAFGAAAIGSAIDNIFSMVNTAIYLDNPNPQNNYNPFQTSGTHIKFGSDMKHSGIMVF